MTVNIFLKGVAQTTVYVAKVENIPTPQAIGKAPSVHKNAGIKLSGERKMFVLSCLCTNINTDLLITEQ